MNERIQNLKDKIWADEYWTKPNTDKLLPAQLNRFAELIVQECLAQVDKVETMLEDEPEQATGASWVGFAIAKHFGVE